MNQERHHLTPAQTLEIIEAFPSIKEEMLRTHFAADLHDSHRKIIDIHGRPTTEEEHREWLITEVINRYVGKKDKLFLLGDVSFASKIDAERHFLSRLNGEKVLVEGNHDRNINKSTYFREIKTRKNFNFSRGGVNIHIVLDHYPIASWERKVYGSWHLHGHVHGKFVNSGLSWDVGIDNKRTLITSDGVEISNLWKPINLYEVCLIMSELAKTNPYYAE
jgi:calcineurin-like phosphoesterase family protein